MSGTTSEQSEPDGITADGPVEVRHRRAPRYGRFITFGLLLAAVFAFALAIVTRGWSEISMSDSFWLMMIWFGPIGMITGAVFAFVLDRRSIARMGPNQIIMSQNESDMEISLQPRVTIARANANTAASSRPNVMN
ncbi:MAG TPA: hypothetical protein VFC82_00160, partial [Actinomycetaceae bacterium]|nr:hypothetical protein [Actinomycetaceae bacterium]